MAPSTTRNQSKWCDFHGEFGHTTEECLSLKFYLEKLAKQGHLGHYLPAGAKTTEPAPVGGKAVINMVIGGSSSPPPGPTSNHVLSLEHGAADCNLITFSDADYEGINPDHNQALVITLDIANHDVRKTLVDNGSSVDVLFAHTLNRMQLGSSRPEPSAEQPLYGFGHKAVPIQGIIHLPVLFGTEPKQVRHMVKFYVINIPSS